MSRIVVKVGGAVAGASADAVLELAARARGRASSTAPGPQISLEMERAGIPVEFVDGRRVTTPERARGRARLVRGGERGALRRDRRARRAAVRRRDRPAGRRRCRSSASSATPCRRGRRRSSTRSTAGQIPVVAPLADGPLNVNADEAAAALAIGARRRRAALPHRRRRADPRRRGRRLDRRRRGRGAARRRHARRAGSSRSSAPRSPPRARGVPAYDRPHGRCRHERAHRHAAPADLCALPGHVRRRRGLWLIADDGQRYLDLVAGIAVVSLGHCHPAPLEAAQRAARAALARLEPLLDRADGAPRRAAVRALRRRALRSSATPAPRRSRRRSSGRARRPEDGARRARRLVPRADDGRALDHRPAGEARAVRAARSRACASRRPRRSPTQSARRRRRSSSSRCRARAASGRSPTRRSSEARALADEYGAMLVFDEVQTGVGRTGEFFAWQRSGRPARRGHAREGPRERPADRRAARVATARPTGFVPGDHASTFGGNPVSCAAACAVVDAIDDDLLEHVRDDRRALRGVAARGARRRPAARGRARTAPPGRSRTRRSSTACSSAPPARRRSGSRRR